MESLNLERGALTVRDDALIGATDRWCWSMLPLFAFAWESCFVIVDLCCIARFITLCFYCCIALHCSCFPFGAAVCAQHMEFSRTARYPMIPEPSGPLLEAPWGFMLAHFSLF